MKKFLPNLTQIISCFFLLLIVSCDEEEPEVYTEYILSSSAEQINLNAGASFNFTVASEYGDDLTDNSTFFINDQEIEGKMFTPTEIGTFNAYAKYEGANTQTIQLNVIEELPTSFTQKLIIEEFTGTWCGNCVDVAYKLHEVAVANSNIIPIAIHGGGDDIMTYENVTTLEDHYGVNGYPKAFVNRGNEGTKWQKTAEELDGILNQNASLGLAINSTLTGNEIAIDVKAAFAENVTNTKLVVYLMENKLIYPQVNYSSHYNGENPIPNYEHNDVLKKSLTDIFGNAMEAQTAGDLFVEQFELTVPGVIENPENISIIAFIVDENNNVINVQTAKIGENKVFD